MNNMSRDLELEQKIDAYLKGKLTEEEAQQLWEKLLERPDYIELLETELGVKSILAKKSDSNEQDSTSAEERSIIYRLKTSKRWIAAAAAVAILVVAINFLQLNTSDTVGDLALKNISVTENLVVCPDTSFPKTEDCTCRFTAKSRL
ncbi:MAG: hypothetical protein U5J63_14595 [Fodinibius sp.]|nr:hypothetical protein [Fodinibius sp.]